jgi:hypothetical protein
MGQISEKTIFRIYEGIIYDFEKKFFGLGLKQFLFPVVLRLRGIILPPPIMGLSKIVCYKTVIFKHN